MAAQLKPGQGPLEFGNRRWLKILFGVIFFMLYLPIIVLIAFSFNTRTAAACGAALLSRTIPRPGTTVVDRRHGELAGHRRLRHDLCNGHRHHGRGVDVALPLSDQARL